MCNKTELLSCHIYILQFYYYIWEQVILDFGLSLLQKVRSLSNMFWVV